jgi:hypothetical protein
LLEKGRPDTLPHLLIHFDSQQILPGAMPMAVTFETAAELVRKLCNIPLERICFTPPPGTATMRDLRNALRRYDRLYELVDVTLVEKTKGLSDSMIAAMVSGRIGNFADEQDLGIRAGADGAVRLLKGLVRSPDVSFFCWDKLPGRVLPSEPIPDLAPDLAVEALSETPASAMQKFTLHPTLPLPPSTKLTPSTAATCCPASRCRWPNCSRVFPSRQGRCVRRGKRRSDPLPLC